MAQKNVKPKPKEQPLRGGYSPSGEEKKVWDQYRLRKLELLDSRKNVSGINVDEKMRSIDRNYFNRKADLSPSELDTDQKPIAINNAFGKVQTALGILIDRNPDIILRNDKRRYSGNRELMRSLGKSSWAKTNSLGQFRLSVFNMAKRGWFVGRTFHKKIVTEARFPLKMDNKGMIQYEKKPVTKMDDIAYLNLDNHNTWIDEEARPEDMFSIRDWAWREVWHIDKVRNTFPLKEFPNMKWVTSGGNTQERIEGLSQSEGSVAQARETKAGLTELFFYENQFDDWFIVEINGVMVVYEPLPQNHKRLSLVTAPWSWRSAEDIYGVGIVEEMEQDEKLIDRVLNMSLRQLLLSINPGGFYAGTEDFENENLKVKAGVFRRTMNPKDITFLEVPPMKKEAMDIIQWIEDKEDQRTGITKTLEGDPTVGKKNDTAYELGVNREAGLKRLRLPLKNLQSAFNWEFMNRIDLIKQVYSDFDVRHVAEEDEIMEYLDEVNADPDFYFIQNEGDPARERFFIKEFREAQLKVEQDDKGEFVESENEAFFKINPEWLSWEGDVTVDVNSILVQSEELEKADTLRMANLTVPLFQLDPNIALKPAKQILQAFNKEPKKWFPQAWIDFMEGKKSEETSVPDNVQQFLERQKGEDQIERPDTIVPPRELGSKPGFMQRMKEGFKTFKTLGQ